MYRDTSISSAQFSSAYQSCAFDRLNLIDNVQCDMYRSDFHGVRAITEYSVRHFLLLNALLYLHYT